MVDMPSDKFKERWTQAQIDAMQVSGSGYAHASNSTTGSSWSAPVRYTGASSGIVSGYVAVTHQRRAIAPTTPALSSNDPLAIGPLFPLAPTVEDGVHITPWHAPSVYAGKTMRVSARLVIDTLAPIVPSPFSPTDLYEAYIYPTWIGLGAYDAARTYRVQIELCPQTCTYTMQVFPFTGPSTPWL